MEYPFPEYDIITSGISILKLVGEFTAYKSQVPINIYRIFNCAMMMLNIILSLTNIPKADAYMYVQIIACCGLFTHALLRYICLVYYRCEIFSLLSDMERFWSIKQANATFRMAKLVLVFFAAIQKIFLVLGILAIMAYSFKPLATKQGLMFPSDILVDFIGFQSVLLFSQYYLFLVMAAVVIGYDIIYICYFAYVIIQIRLLKYKFEHITLNIDTEIIKSYVRHHQFMLKIFDRLKGIYFWMFLFQYAITLLSGCMQLYVVIFWYTHPSDLVVSALYVSGLFFEFGLYTSVVEEVVSQFTSIASSIYKSMWYERTLEDRKVLLFIMMKGQRQSYFSAGGLVEINVDTFGSVQLAILALPYFYFFYNILYV